MKIREMVRERMRNNRIRVSDLRIGIPHSTIYEFVREKNPTETNTKVIGQLLDALDLKIVGVEVLTGEAPRFATSRELDRLRAQVDRLKHEVEDAERRNAHLYQVINSMRNDKKGTNQK
jgi:hypothetical protein